MSTMPSAEISNNRTEDEIIEASNSTNLRSTAQQNTAASPSPAMQVSIPERSTAEVPTVHFASPTEIIPPAPIPSGEESSAADSPAGGFLATITPPPPASATADNVTSSTIAAPTSQPNANQVSDQDIAELSQQLKEATMKSKNRIAFEPIASLPPSRMPSHEYLPLGSPRQRPVDSHGPSHSASMVSINSPPLTPSGTDIESNARSPTKHHVNGHGESVITPQPSTSNERSSKIAAEHLCPRPQTASDHSRQNNHRRGMFSLGPSGSTPNSRESSPSRAGSYYSRPFTPAGDSSNPYAASRRAPQAAQPHPKQIEPRFHFTRGKKKHSSPSSSSVSLLSPDKRHRDDHSFGHTDSHATSKSSMVDLKRFFKKSHHGHKGDKSPGGKSKGTPIKSGHSLPFGEDHGLTTKYGKFGKVLGSGAGGSVRVMKRSDDNTVFAVKEFRARHAHETEKDYAKKLTGEFCIGSTLHHGNVIETLDILQERGRWFVVMEYAPFDLFAIVMTGRMSRAEVSCAFLQILNGVTYLHSMGLAHRDLKLDNVVVSANGIMKIIDFGSAHVFRYPFEDGIIKAKGIVGSDPYLAPEVYEEKTLYDPRGVDIWSLGIIYCCMTLRRFPWKVPRTTDNSYKLFASEPSPGHDPARLMFPVKQSEVTSPSATGEDGDYFSSNHGSSSVPKHAHHFGPATVPGPGTPAPSTPNGRRGPTSPGGSRGPASPNARRSGRSTPSSRPTSPAPPRHRAALDPLSPHGNPGTPGATSNSTSNGQHHEKKEHIKGPWRILRLLPKESRKVIYGMLTIDPAKRMTMDDIIQDEWVSNTVICQQLDGGEVSAATDHKHTLEPPMSASQAPAKPPAPK